MNKWDDNIDILDSVEVDNFSVEVIAYKSLDGGSDIATAESLYFARQANMRLKQVHIKINKSAAILEPGALHFMKGNIEMEAKAGGTGGVGGVMRGLTSMMSGETFFRPRYSGTGEIFLEPSFGHYIIYKLKQGDTLIADDGMFCCSEASVKVSAAIEKSLKTIKFGGEGAFQTKVTGPGICVFQSPVPAHEVMRVELSNEKLQVDGNFALMRSGNIKYSVQKSSKRSWIGSAVSGEGWLQTFEGTGYVWLAPTQAIYDMVTDRDSLARLAQGQGSSNTRT